MEKYSPQPTGELLISGTLVGLILGSAVASVVLPSLSGLSRLVVATTVVLVLVAPYIPGVDIRLSIPMVGIYVSSIGVYGLATELGSPLLMGILLVGGSSMFAYNIIRRKHSYET